MTVYLLRRKLSFCVFTPNWKVFCNSLLALLHSTVADSCMCCLTSGSAAVFTYQKSLPGPCQSPTQFWGIASKDKSQVKVKE